MQIEDPLNTNVSLTPYKKEDFTKAMNCSVALLDSIDEKITGNLCGRFCGRTNSKKNIWVGLFFDYPTGYRLSVGFAVNTSTKEASKFINIYLLLQAHYNYEAIYTEIDAKCYWFYVNLNNKIDTTYEQKDAQTELNAVIRTVLKYEEVK